MITILDDILIILSLILSILGTSYVIVNYLTHPHLQTMAFKFVYNLTIADFIWTMTIFSNVISKAFLHILVAIFIPHIMSVNFLCTGFAAIKLFSRLSALLWTATISKKLYESIFLEGEESFSDDESFTKSYIVCYGFPAISSIGQITFN